MAINEITTPTEIATFDDRTGGNPLDIQVAIEPVQNLHGYSSAWIGGTGKNIFPPSVQSSKSSNGITITTNGDGVYRFSGTATGAGNIEFDLVASCVIPTSIGNGGTGAMFLFNSAVLASGNYIGYLNGSTLVDSWAFMPANRVATTYTTMAGKTINKIRFAFTSGTNLNGFTCSPMFTNDGSTTATFEPYENICPITGLTEAKITRTGKNLFSNTAKSSTLVGVTYTKNADGSIHVKGTATAWTGLDIATLVLRPGTYIMSAGNTGSYSNLYLETRGLPNQISTSRITADATFEVFETTTVRFILFSRPNIANNDTVYPMLRLASNTDATYEPYAGSKTYSVSFGSAGTVYKGTLDVGSGTLTVTQKHYSLKVSDMNNANDYPGWAISDLNSVAGAEINNIFDIPTNIGSGYGMNTRNATGVVWLPMGKYGSEKTQTWWKTNYPNLMVDILVNYATPVIYQLTLNQISTLLNENNVWSDTGKINSIKGGYAFHDKLTSPVTQNDAIDKINELVDDYKDVSNAGMLSYADKEKIDTLESTYLPVSGGTMTGQVKWLNSAALPQTTSPQYLVAIDSFAQGGTQKWANIADVTVGKANTADALSLNPAGRPTSANNNYHDGKLRYYLASSTMTTGKPPKDSKIIHLPWDNAGWDAQIALSSIANGTSEPPQMYIRAENGEGTWSDWATVYHDKDRTNLFNSILSYDKTIATNANLNSTTYLATGRYACTSNSIAQTLINSPGSNTGAFVMEVSNTITSPEKASIVSDTWLYRTQEITTYTGSQRWIRYCQTDGNGNWLFGTWIKEYPITKSDIGLGNVDNTADANKSVSKAATLTTARTIDGVSFNGSANISHYGSCAISGRNGTVACTGFTLAAGAWIAVFFPTSNNTTSSEALLLNVNSTGGKEVKYYRSVDESLPANAYVFSSNRTYLLVYDGTNYRLIGDLDTTVTYDEGTAAQLSAGSVLQAELWSPKILHDYIAGASVSYATSAGSATSATNATNASKVNNYTVNANVPADAVFTDTKYNSGTANDLTTGTSTDLKVWTPKILHDYIAGASVSYATSAGTATSATTATTATSATSATTATTATKANGLTTARAIDGVLFQGLSDITHYGYCQTAASTAGKAVQIVGFDIANIPTGSRISVKFQYTNTAAVGSLTLTINNGSSNSTAKYIKYRGANLPTADSLKANGVYEFVYDGTYWQLVGDLDSESNVSTTWQQATITNSTVTYSSGGHYTSGRHCYVQMQLTTAKAISANTVTNILSGMPAPTGSLAVLSISIGNKMENYMAQVTTGGVLRIRSAAALSTGATINITGVYTIS